jgi:hypothetical protein
MCSICKRGRLVLHPIGRNHPAANISLCNLLVSELKVEQKLQHTDVKTTRVNYADLGKSTHGQPSE